MQRVFNKVFGKQFKGNRSYLQKKLDSMKVNAVAWDGTLLLEQMSAKVDKINKKMFDEILDGIHEQVNDSNK